MDIYVQLTNGNVVPITGVTGTPTSIDAHPTITLHTTATTTQGSHALTSVVSTTGIVPGMYAYGTGIQEGTRVVAFTANSVVVLSRPVTKSGTTVNVGFAGVSAADYELMRLDSGVYRDLFTASTEQLAATYEIEWNAGEDQRFHTTAGNYAAPGIVAVAKGELVPNGLPGQAFQNGDPTNSATGAAITPAYGDMSASDEIDHMPPRSLSWYESLWAFTSVVGSETVIHYFRKSLVVGWGNVPPQI